MGKLLLRGNPEEMALRSEAGTPAGGEGNLPLSVEGAVLNRENPRTSG